MKNLKEEMAEISKKATEVFYQKMDELGIGIEEREVSLAVLFNSHDEVTHVEILGIGLNDRVSASHKSIIKAISKTNSSRIIILHNHPFGEIEPSEEDLQEAAKLTVLCNIIEVDLFDFIIVGKDNVHSTKQEMASISNLLSVTFEDVYFKEEQTND